MSSPSSYTYSLVLPGLYLGGDGYLKDPTIIDEADITHIVSIGDEYGFVQSLPYVTEHMYVPVADLSSAPLSTHFPDIIAFVHRGRLSGHTVLLHCGAGRSRSATAAIAYVMAAAHIPLPGAHAHVMGMHRPTSPNDGFRMQLLEFDGSGAMAQSREALSQLEESHGRTLRNTDAAFIAEKSKIVTSFSALMNGNGTSSAS